jgi:hypothetical protein
VQSSIVFISFLSLQLIRDIAEATEGRLVAYHYHEAARGPLIGRMLMRDELQQRLVDRWPTWFSIGGDPRYTSMHFGFQHGDGWFDLLWRLCERLEPVVAAAEKKTGRPFELLQVKEKIGGLRFYANSKNEAISTLIEAAEIESFFTCEVCGQPGKPQGGSRIQTLCDEHARAQSGAEE